MFELEKVRQNFIRTEGFSLSCVFISKEYELKKAVIEKPLKKDLIEGLINQFNKLTVDKKVVEYDPIVKIDDCIDNISVNEIRNLQNIKNGFEDISHVSPINSIEEAQNSRAYVMILKKGEEEYMFFRKFSPSTYLKSKCKILFNEGKLEKCDKEILSIDYKFDCVVYNKNMLIFNQTYFEQIFDYKDEYTRKANDNINRLEGLKIIENIDSIRKESEKITIRKKLAKVKETDVEWFKGKIRDELENIKQIIKDARLDMEIANGKVIANDISELIHLIQNDYLQSNLSGDNFVAEKKTKIAKK